MFSPFLETMSVAEVTSPRVFHEEAKSYYLPVDEEEHERYVGIMSVMLCRANL